MPRPSRNEHLVPDADKPYYRSATVVGLRQQLNDEGLDTDGLKYDLYLRLVNAGFPLYTDDRQTSDGDDHDGDQSDGDQGDADGDQGDDGQGHKPSRKAAPKRGRDSSSSSDSPSDDGSGDPRPPPPRRRRLNLPTELTVQVIQNLHPSALWNLIDTAPEEYLDDANGGVNALILEARSHHALDHPPPPPPVPVNGGQNNGYGAGAASGGDPGPPPDSPPGSDDHGSDGHSSDSHSSNDDENRRTMSLLEWVGDRATYDSQFRRTNHSRIRRVIAAYLTVYGMADPAPGSENPRDDILYFFRDRTDIANPAAVGARSETPLSLAAGDWRPIVVQLLLIHGAQINQSIGGWRPLDRAVAALDQPLHVNSAPSLQVIFTLLASGANLGLLRQETQRTALDLIADFRGFDDVDRNAPPATWLWPRIYNPLGVSIREFIGDERSSYWDRVLISMYVIYVGSADYPLFV